MDIIKLLRVNHRTLRVTERNASNSLRFFAFISYRCNAIDLQNLHISKEVLKN